MDFLENIGIKKSLLFFFCRYCSNLYPKAECYRVCNWCLSPKDISGEKTQNSSNSSSSCRNTTSDDNIQGGPKLKKKLIIKNENNDIIGRTSPKGKLKSCNLKVQVIKKNPNKLQKSPLLAARKRVIIDEVNIEEKIRTKSEEISNRGITTKVIRNRVRRYKLLDEVSS